MQRNSFIAAVLGLLVASRAAWATPIAPARGGADASSPKTSTNSADASSPKTSTSSAGGAPHPSPEVLFAEGQRLYDAGDLPQALRQMTLCYEQTRAVNLLYNLAVIYRELGDCPSALDHFQRFVNEADATEQRDDASRQVATLSQECPPRPSTQSAQPTPPSIADSGSPKAPLQHPSPKPDPAPSLAALNSPEASHWKTAGWIAFGTAIAAAAGATYFIVEAVDAKHDTRKARTSEEFEGPNSALVRDSALAGVLGTASLAAAGVGTYSLVMAAKRQRAASGFSLAPTPAGALIDCWFRF